MNSKKAKQLRKDAKKFASNINAVNASDKIYKHLKKSTKGLEVPRTKAND